MEQPQQQYQDRRYESLYTSKIKCTDCRVYIRDCGDCDCEEAFSVNEGHQREREHYTTRFLQFLNHFIQIGLPNLSPEARDRFELQLQRAARRGVLNAGILHGNNHRVHGLQIKLRREQIELNETQARQSSNGRSTGNEEEDHIVNSGSDNAAQQLNIASSSNPLEAGEREEFLRLRLTSVPEEQSVYLDILGDNLDWQRILQDVEANTLQLRWAFYEIVEISSSDSSEDDRNVGVRPRITSDESESQEDDSSEDEDIPPPVPVPAPARIYESEPDEDAETDHESESDGETTESEEERSVITEAEISGDEVDSKFQD